MRHHGQPDSKAEDVGKFFFIYYKFLNDDDSADPFKGLNIGCEFDKIFHAPFLVRCNDNDSER